MQRRTDRFFEGSVLPGARIASWLVVIIVSVVFGLLLTIVSGEYNRRATVDGVLLYSPGQARIRSARGGRVIDLRITEGDDVQEGDIIAVLDVSRPSDGTSAAENKILSILERSRDRLLKKIAYQRYLETIAIQVSIEELQHYEVQSGKAKVLVAGAEARVDILSSQLVRQKTLLAQGAISLTEVDLAANQLLDAQQEANTQRLRLAELLARGDRIRAELNSIPIEAELSIMETQGELEGVNRAIVETQSAEKAVIVAETSGVVSAIFVNQGDTLSSGDRILDVVPHSASLQAFLVIPTRVAGFIEPGATVHLRIDAYPYQKFGFIAAVLNTPTQRILAAHESVGPLITLEPSLLATADLTEQVIHAYGTEIALKNGLTLKADINQGSRPIVQWILDPIYAVGRKIL